jgi:hypothetical protein
VRNSWAGERTPAPCGQASAAGEPPIAIVTPVRAASLSVLSVMRNAVASASGLTRSSTRSAALLA